MPLVGLAALELLAAGAGRAPVLVVAEDVHWLDSSTCEVLAFVARRLGTDPVGLVGTAREAELEDNPLAGAGLAELRLGPLDAVAAAALLDAHGVLDPVVRQRVLAEAAGNPLALVELPVTAGQHDSHGAVNEWIPLTRRLEQAFASRLPGLPAVTRTALLAAGLNDGDALGEVLAAASVVAGAPVQVADLAAAVAAGLAEVDGQRVRFRHPPVRSAVCEAAGLAARQAMHRALAEVLAGVPDRQVWHRAAASVGPDEEVAAGLENAADRAFGRGAIAEQAQALAAAARLSPGPALRGQRLIRAAWAFYDLGRPQTTLRLLDEAEPLDLEPGDRLRLSWYRESTGAATRSGTRPLAALADLADQMRQHGYNDQALLTLESVAIRCYWSNPDRRTRRRMTAVAEAVPVAGDDPRLLYVLALSDPARHGAAVLARLAQHQPGSGTAYQDYLLGYAAAAVGACEQAVGFHTVAAGGLRARGSLGLLGTVLLSQGWSALLLGQAGLAGPGAEEAARLLCEGGRPLSAACAQLVQAVLAGRRGDTAAADLAGQAERVLLMGACPRCWPWSSSPAEPRRSAPAVTTKPTSSWPGSSTRTTPPTTRTCGPGPWSTWPRPPPAAATRTPPAAAAPSSSPRRPQPARPCCAPAWPWRHRCWLPPATRRRCLTLPSTSAWRAGRCTAPGCSSHTACGCAAASRPATPARRCAPPGTPSTRSAPMPGPSVPAASCAPPASAAASPPRGR